MLLMELNTTQGSSVAAHHQGILEVCGILLPTSPDILVMTSFNPQEVHSLLAVVVRRNQMEAAAHLSQELFESWRQLVETALHAMLQDDIKKEFKVTVLFELIQDLLIKVHTTRKKLCIRITKQPHTHTCV